MATIRSQGGLLPADILARVAALDSDLGGLGLSDFHLAPNERLGEAIARSWARLTSAWEAFSNDRDGLQSGDHAGKLTRDRWLLPLFSELGYGRLVQQPGVEIEGKTYAVFCEYNHSPLHLVGAGVPLDRRTAGVRGAADQSPHSVVQELLNRSSERLWGIVTNGLSLRLLRDNVTLTRQAYVEFDLEAILATEAYEDFALLWLCAHQSRLEAEVPEECWLERWTQAAQRDGTRALSELRSGVERAIEGLGRGFLAQSANTGLHDALRTGGLDGPSYYRELLRLIYRLLFLFVAEDRDALLLPDDGTVERFDARERYDRYYATKRLRRLSVRRRGGRAHDLYEQVKLLSSWLHDDGQPLLALPALGSALWSAATTPHVSGARLGNEALLEAIRELSFVEGGRRPVDFRNLGAEELGSVYESLLELHPAIDRETARFSLGTAAGHERKQTGSYYTPTSLIGSLLETALDPVIDTAAKSEDPERALLDLTVCDPACGSGHFLIAAANRIGKRLAAIREQDPEPAPEAIRHALRDVVSRCIHGVDVNPMAVELCKVSLWLEALEPGRPLSFLDHRIVLGNSLLGTTPELLAAGIPADAFKPILGDDKQTVAELRKRNAKELAGQLALDMAGATAEVDVRALATQSQSIAAVDDRSLAGVLEQQRRFEQLLGSPQLRRAGQAADIWCAAFVVDKRTGVDAITQDVLVRALGAVGALSDSELALVQRAKESYAFLHWHVAFPAVWERGGFDVVLGNPPWEHTELKEKEFFAVRQPEIAAAPTGAARKRMIDALRDDHPALYAEFEAAKRQADGYSHFVRSSDRYPLCGRGRINTYAIFAELMRSVVASGGCVGCIVPTGIATDDTTKYFFQEIAEQRSLVSLFDFRNNSDFFPDVAGAQGVRFCLMTLSGRDRVSEEVTFCFRADSLLDVSDPDRRVVLNATDIALLNPNTNTCPIFRTQRDATVTTSIYRRVPVINRELNASGNPWGITYRQGLFNMTTDSGLFRTSEQLLGQSFRLEGNIFRRGTETYVPLYEGKMIHLYHHRFGDYSLATLTGREVRQIPEAAPEVLVDPGYAPLPRYWVPEHEVDARLSGRWDHEWFLVWRDVTAATQDTVRTIVAAVIPRVGVGHKLPIAVVPRPAGEFACVVAAMSSFVLDYVARQKLGATSLGFFIVNQLPLPAPSDFRAAATWAGGPTSEWIAARVLELVYCASDLAGFARDLGYDGPPFRWDLERRSSIRAELDAAMLHLYGIERDDAQYILGTFPVVRRKDEQLFGEYRTQRLILECYDAMAAADDAGHEYVTALDPPPGDWRAAAGT